MINAIRNVNDLTDNEVATIIRKIRRIAAKKLESIRTVKDAYGCDGYLIVDSNRNVIIDGNIFPLDLETLAERYDVVI